MWIVLSLLSAVGAAATSLALKQAVAHGGVVLSTAVFRVVAGVLLAGVVAATGGWPPLGADYWRTASLMLVPEVAGTLCLSLALRAGDLSLVQPLLGLLPLLVMAAGAAFLGEVPSPRAGLGVALVTAGVYAVGLRPGASLAASALAPLRALAGSPASWYALGAAVCWSVTTVLHKRGIAAVGPFPWAVTLALGSGLALAAALPVIAARAPDGVGAPRERGRWSGRVALAAVAFAIHQVGLHGALGVAQAGYVIALSSTSVLIAVALGVVLLRERAAARSRVLGGALVTLGAALVALWG